MHIEAQIRPGSFGRLGVLLKSNYVLMVGAMVVAVFTLLWVGNTSGSNARRSVPSQDGGNNGVSRAAIEDFWTIYHGNDYGGIAKVQQELKTAIQSDPNNPTLYALLGATHFWHVGEASRDPNAQADLRMLRH